MVILITYMRFPINKTIVYSKKRSYPPFVSCCFSRATVLCCVIIRNGSDRMFIQLIKIIINAQDK